MDGPAPRSQEEDPRTSVGLTTSRFGPQRSRPDLFRRHRCDTQAGVDAFAGKVFQAFDSW
jgi:hypothetical protein